MSKVRIALQSLVAGTIAVALLPSGARADSDALKVFGYITNAVATPVAFQYDQPSFGVPAKPTFELRLFHSEAHTDSGPSGRALSSIAWPGDLAGNAPLSLMLDTFLPRDLIPIHPQEDTIWEAVRNGFVEGSSQAPPYPERAECFYPVTEQNKARARNDLGAGISMSCSQTRLAGQAITTGNNASFPQIFKANNLNSSAFSGIRDGVAVSEAVAAAKELSLLDGLITVQGFKTEKTITSDGVKAKIEGGMEISGLTIAGTRVLSLDPGGPSIGDQAVDWDAAMRVIHEQLEPQGITVKLAEETKSVQGAEGRSRVFGISIRLDSSAMRRFRDNLPAPINEYLSSPGSSPAGPAYKQAPGTATGVVESILRFDQSFTVLLGDVSINSAATPPFEFEFPDIPVPPMPDELLPPTVIDDFPTPAGPAAPASGGQPFAPATRPVGSSAGVPAPLATMAFVLAAGATAGLRMLADRVCAGAPEGARCSL